MFGQGLLFVVLLAISLRSGEMINAKIDNNREKKNCYDIFLSLFFFLFCFFLGEMKKQTTRIFGGENVDRGDLPYMALVKQLVRGDICGGAIISERHILTGGMCAKYHTRPFDRSIVITGTVSLEYGGIIHRIMHAIAHPLFHRHYPNSIRYDIGVITVSNCFLNFNK